MSKDKSIDDKPWYVREREMRGLGEQYGVDYKDYQENGRGTGWSDRENYERFEKDVIAAGSNDYDTRRSIEAAKTAGYEGAEDLDNGLNTLQSLQNAQDFMRGIHEDELGHTGKFSSTNDYGNVTNFLVKNDRDKFTEQMENSFSDYVEENQPEAADPVNQQTEDITYSPELQAAHSRFSQAQQELANAESPFARTETAKSLEPAESNGMAQEHSDGKEQRFAAAQNFHDDYKLSLMQGLRDNPLGRA